LKWLYTQNPTGHAIGYDAFCGEELAAHYVCIPVSVELEGRVQKSLLSLNTATHPKYQGKGLFTKLAEMTYAEGLKMGFQSVYGVANGNSTPGFLKRLGFQLISPLDAWIGIGELNSEPSLNTLSFRRVWSKELLLWRFNNPFNKITARRSGDNLICKGSTGFPLLSACAELKCLNFNLDSLSTRSSIFESTSLNLYLGLMPGNSPKRNTYLSIPSFLRPSPLNLIFRSLDEAISAPKKGEISFNFLDFDAY
jgi:hypothetical protein